MKRANREGHFLNPHRDIFLPTIDLDRMSSVPLHRQIATQIERAIVNGTTNGNRLPSTRVMAQLLGVSRNTVLTAYDELLAAGVLRSQRGSGVRVAAHAPLPGLTAPELEQVVRAARFPARAVSLTDLDGNRLYLRF